MFVLRSIQHDDFDSLLSLAARAGPGMTTLKAEPKALQARINLAIRSFAGELAPRDADYVFVLEDLAHRSVVGVSAIKAAVGLDEPFYNFRLGRLVHSSRELGIYADKRTLYLTNDYTGSAELCSLFLDPAYRSRENGRLLSKGRMMFIASNLDLLPDTVIAELRGYLREDGTSPFWESLGRHFFRMDFHQADDISSLGSKSFIAELMPRLPVYTDFLTEEARNAIGVVHRSTEPARRLLEQEGFWHEGYVDIFDAGPVVQAHTKGLRLVREGRLAISRKTELPVPSSADTHAPLLAATTRLADFRAIVVRGTLEFGRIDLSTQEYEALQLADGDAVRVAALNPGVNLNA